MGIVRGLVCADPRQKYNIQDGAGGFAPASGSVVGEVAGSTTPRIDHDVVWKISPFNPCIQERRVQEDRRMNKKAPISDTKGFRQNLDILVGLEDTKSQTDDIEAKLGRYSQLSITSKHQTGNISLKIRIYIQS